MAQQKINTGQQQRDIIQTSLTANQTIGASGSAINLSTTQFSIGSKLSRSGSSIIIGPGVSLVRVSYTLMADGAGSSPYLFSQIRKNGTAMSQALNGSASGFGSNSETKFVEVVEGDALTVHADSGGANLTLSTSRFQFMSVEVIQ